MHYTSWLVSVTLCTTSVSAFYPCIGNADIKEDNVNIPTSARAPEILDGQITTVDIKKRRNTVSQALACYILGN
jgi:hypothetical protein